MLARLLENPATLWHIEILLKFVTIIKCISSSLHALCQICFWKFTGKHFCRGLYFIAVKGWKPETASVKRLLYRCFFSEYCEIFKNAIFKNTSWQLLLKITWQHLWILFKHLYFLLLIINAKRAVLDVAGSLDVLLV